MIGEADFGLTEMAFDANSNRFQGDQSLYIRFSVKPHQNKRRTIEEGRPIFEDKEFIMIMQPGNKESIIERPVRDADRQRFARQYSAFKVNSSSEVVEGTPLEEWPGITRSQVEELKYLNVRTVEQLASMSDSNAQNFMGINTLKSRAKVYLESATDNSAVEKLAANLEEKDNQIAVLQESLAELSARLSELEPEADE